MSEYTFEDYMQEVYGMSVWDSPLNLYNKAKEEYKKIMEEEEK